MNILQVLERADVGGAEAVATSYLRACRDLGHDCVVYALVGEADHALFESVDSYRELTSEVVRRSSSADKILIHSLRLLIILTFLLIINSCCLKKVYFVSHFNYSAAKRILIFLCSHLIGGVISTSLVSERKLRSARVNGLIQISNFLARTPVLTQEEFLVAENIERVAAERTVIAFVGVFKEGKRVLDMATLACFLSPEKYFFCIIGDGKDREILKQKFDEQGYIAGTDYTITGLLKNPAAVLRQTCDVLFFPSYNNYEMQSMVVVEASAVGIPVISWDIEAMEQAVPSTMRVSFGDFKAVVDIITTGRLEKGPVYDLAYGKRRLIELLSL